MRYNKTVKPKLLVIIAGVMLAVVVPGIVFLSRSPVLIVLEASFIPLYGETRVRDSIRRSSFALFRQVKLVPVADDVSVDIVRYAIQDVSGMPFCVIFPLRFAQAAQNYREHHPDIPVVILQGRTGKNANPAEFAISYNTEDYFLFRTDISADFYLAGLAAAILNSDNYGRIAVFLEDDILPEGSTAFLQALEDAEKPLETSFFTSFIEYYGIAELSIAVIAGTGIEFLERQPSVPVILFTWLDPSFIPLDVVLIFNDSPFAQTIDAVRMVRAGQRTGEIRSRKEIFSGRSVDNRTVRKIKKL